MYRVMKRSIFRGLQTMSTSTRPSTISRAGCLIIGDEVLNGKILDTNSHKFSKFCFNKLSIPLKKTIVCSDDKEDIIRSLSILREECDFIVTSGGIGPTHDDVTYESLADAYNLRCELDEEVMQRMQSKRGTYLQSLDREQLEAFHKMAKLPTSSGLNNTVDIKKIFIDDTLWVPILQIDHTVYVLPGVPQLFEKLLYGLEKHIKSRVSGIRLSRFYVKTTTKESELAPFLTALQKTCNSQFGRDSVKLGSYPHFAQQVNTISIIGSKDIEVGDLRLIVEDVLQQIGGDAIEITEDEEDLLTKDIASDD